MTDVSFDELIDKYLHSESYPRKVGRYWPSDSGNCVRKVWFGFKMPKPVEKDVKRIFEAGNRMHEFIADVIDSDKNDGVELVEKEMPIKIQTLDFVIAGKIDDMMLVKINNEKYLIEVKSAKFLPRTERKSHKLQLQLYMHSTGIHKGILLYVKKDDLKTAQFDLFYNKKLVESQIDKFQELHKALVFDKIPEPEAKFDKEMEWMCEYCPYAKECGEAGGF